MDQDKKWLLRLRESIEQRKVLATKTPRMGLVLTGLNYDLRKTQYTLEEILKTLEEHPL